MTSLVNVDAIVASLQTAVTNIINTLSGKANTAAVNSSLADKADKATTLSGYGIADAFTKTETNSQIDSRIQNVIGAAPAALDTLAELATQLSNDEGTVASLTNAVSLKADKTYVDSGLASKESSISAGTNSQYLRGDKSWRDLTTDVIAIVLTGLSLVTSSAVVSSDSILVAIGKLQAQLTALTTLVSNKENSVTVGTTSDFYRGDKTWVSFSTTALGVLLNGLSTATSSAIISTDSFLIAFGKLQAQITTAVSSIASKADTTTVNSALALKADKGTTLSAYGIVDAYTMTQTDSRIQAVVGAAPAALDTLVEIAAQLSNDESAVSALTTTVAGKEPLITAGTSAQYLKGNKTLGTFATDVLSTILTGLSLATSTDIIATDTVIVALGKIQAQLDAVGTLISTAITAERTAIVNLTNKTLIEPIIRNYTEYTYSANVTGAVTVDLANGTLQKLTLTGNTTITLPASVVGKSYTLIIAYNGAFIPTFAGGGTLKWAGQAAPPAKSTNGYMDIFVFTCDGTNTLGRSGGSSF